MQVKDIAGGLRKGFATYKEHFERAGAELKSVQQRIGELQQEHRVLHFHQASKDEFKQAIFSEIDRLGAAGMQRRKDMLFAWQKPKDKRPRPHFEGAALTWPSVKSVIDGRTSFGGMLKPFLFASQPGDYGGEVFDSETMCCFLGDAIKKNIEVFLDQVEWPEVVPSSQNADRVAAIEVELGTLRSTEAELIALINDNSIKPVEPI